MPSPLANSAASDSARRFRTAGWVSAFREFNQNVSICSVMAEKMGALTRNSDFEGVWNIPTLIIFPSHNSFCPFFDGLWWADFCKGVMSSNMVETLVYSIL